MIITAKQTEVILNGNYKFSQLGFSMMVTRLKVNYAKDPTPAALQKAVEEINLFFEKFLIEFKELPLNGFIGELQRVLKELGIGILRVEKADPDKGEFTLTVSEDLDCSGLPDLGIEVCNYDEGFIAGIFFKYTGVTFHAKEVDCWCSGDRTCRFAVNRLH